MIYAYGAQQMGMTHVIDCDEEELKEVVELFTSKTEQFPNGSSFMVTSEPHSGRMRVYMSDASQRRFSDALRHKHEPWRKANVEHG